MNRMNDRVRHDSNSVKRLGREELFTLTGTFGRERLRNSQLWFDPGYRPINGTSI